jgi:hypothetical protein
MNPNSSNRRPGIERVAADVRRRKPHLSDQAVIAEAKSLYCSRVIAVRTPTGLVLKDNPLYRGGRGQPSAIATNATDKSGGANVAG